MRATPAEKLETIRLVEGSDLPVRRTLEELEVARSTFYRWYRSYEEEGYAGLEGKGFYPGIADTSKKADNGPGGVSCQNEGSILRSSSAKRS